MRESSIADRLVFALAQGIAKGRWLPGHPLPPLRDLALELGVSPPTAAKAVRLAAKEGLVSLRRKQPATVLPEAPQIACMLLSQSQFPVENSAEILSDRTRIALLFPEGQRWQESAWMRSFVAHLDAWADKAGQVLEPVSWPHKEQVPFALSLPAHGYAGAVCLGMREFYRIGLEALRKQKFPTVITNRQYRHVNLPAVTTDDYKPARELALRLIRLGHRNLSLVADMLAPTDAETHGAIRGWVEGLAEGGVLDECPVPTCIVPLLPALRRSSRVFAQLLLRPDRPTALFFYCSAWVGNVLRDPRFAQLRVPEDISVVCAMTGERPISLPDGQPIAVLDVDYDHMAYRIIQTLADQMAGKPCPKVLLLPSKLHLTGSVGPAPNNFS